MASPLGPAEDALPGRSLARSLLASGIVRSAAFRWLANRSTGRQRCRWRESWFLPITTSWRRLPFGGLARL